MSYQNSPTATGISYCTVVLYRQNMSVVFDDRNRGNVVKKKTGRQINRWPQQAKDDDSLPLLNSKYKNSSAQFKILLE